MNQLKAGVVRRFNFRSFWRGLVSPEADARRGRFEARSNLLSPTSAEEVILSYKRVQGGFEGAWMARRSRYGEERTW
jgi:hypothetical protein